MLSAEQPSGAGVDLVAIATLAAALNDTLVRHWLIGGWAVDAHLGRVSRDHSDIDWAVFLADRARFTDVVTSFGFTSESTQGDAPFVELFSSASCSLEVTYLVETEAGEIVTPGFEHWPYPAGSLAADTAEIDGVSVRVMSAHGLLDSKQGWQLHLGEPPRAHDLADITRLREHLGELDDQR